LKTETYTLPAWAGCPLVNDDASGLPDAEVLELESWLSWTGQDKENFYPVGMPEPIGFEISNDMNNLSGECIEIQFCVGE